MPFALLFTTVLVFKLQSTYNTEHSFRRQYSSMRYMNTVRLPISVPYFSLYGLGGTAMLHTMRHRAHGVKTWRHPQTGSTSRRRHNATEPRLQLQAIRREIWWSSAGYPRVQSSYRPIYLLTLPFCCIAYTSLRARVSNFFSVTLPAFMTTDRSNWIKSKQNIYKKFGRYAEIARHANRCMNGAEVHNSVFSIPIGLRSSIEFEITE